MRMMYDVLCSFFLKFAFMSLKSPSRTIPLYSFNTFQPLFFLDNFFLIYQNNFFVLFFGCKLEKIRYFFLNHQFFISQIQKIN